MFNNLVPQGLDSLLLPYCSMGMNYHEVIFVIHIDVNLPPCDSTKGIMRAISSAFSAEVLSTKAWSFIALSMVTTAYPAHSWPFSTKLLPSVYRSQSGATMHFAE